MFYSFWVRLPTACPKVVVLLDLWSDYFWEGHRRETEELKKADLVVVISRDEFRTLRDRGIQRLLWMPPRVPAEDMSDSDAVGLLGSNGSVNREGLAWLTRGLDGSFPIRVYGALAEAVQGRGFVRCGRYAETMQPYRECGIILMPTAEGMGVQVKTIEALAAGRAIVARRGAIRGIPRDSEAWMEVETAGDMIRCARELRNSVAARMALSRKAREYYDRHLQAERLFAELAGAYRELVYKTQASRTSVVSQK
jgi:glycosyltransferase involved in cell wall biosynthesis